MKEFDPGEGASIVSITDQRAAARDRHAGHLRCISSARPRSFVGAEESVAMVGERRRDFARSLSIAARHSCARHPMATRIVMGGDDGKLVALDAKGEVTLLATDPKRRWIDNVALHPDGAVAWSAGKTAFVRSGKGEEKSFDAPSTVGGLAFAPKGPARSRSRITTA